MIFNGGQCNILPVLIAQFKNSFILRIVLCSFWRMGNNVPQNKKPAEAGF